ncbi:MAG: SdrD B-like domain-containing protein [Verrucomicrobiota bacterium]
MRPLSSTVSKFFLTLILLWTLSPTTRATEFVTVFCSGDAVQGGGTLASFAPHSLGDGGHVGGYGTINLSGGGQESGVLLGNPNGAMDFVILEGDNVGGAGVAFQGLGAQPVDDVYVDAAGAVAMVAQLDLGNPLAFLDEGVVTGGSGGVNALLWGGQSPAPGLGGTSEVGEIRGMEMNQGGAIAAIVSVSGASFGSGNVIYLGNAGGLIPVVEPDKAYPGLPSGKTLDGINGMHLAEDGAVFFNAVITPTGDGVTSANQQRIWYFANGTVTEVARIDQAPGGGSWAQFLVHEAAATNAFAIEGFIGGDFVIHTGSVGSLTQVFRDGDSAPGTGLNFSSFSEPTFSLSPNRVGALSAFVDDSGIREGLWRHAGGSLALVAFEGDPVPGFPDADFLTLRPSVTPGGKVVFQAENSLDPPTLADKGDGIWFDDGSGPVALLLHRDVVDLPGVGPTQIFSPEFPTTLTDRRVTNAREEAVIEFSAGGNCVGVISTIDPSTPGSVSGSVEFDADGDGSAAGGGSGIDGLSVHLFLDDGNGAPSGPAIDTTTTNSSGEFAFDSISGGDYHVRVFASQAMLDANHLWTLPDSSPAASADQPVTVSPGLETSDVVFLSTNPVDIMGFVWEDTDDDGQPNAGLAGATVTLFRTAGNLQIDSVTTSAGGSFSFQLLPPGDYYIIETDPDQYVSVSDSDGANDNRVDLTLVANVLPPIVTFVDRDNSPFIATLRAFDPAFGGEDSPYTNSSKNSADRSAPLELLSSNPNLLALQEEITKGLIADGVTPLILELSARDPFAGLATVRWTMEVENGSLAGGIYAHAAQRTPGLGWEDAVVPSAGSFNEVEVATNSPGFLQIRALDPWDLQFDPGETELRVILTLIDPVTEDVIGTRTFCLRRPILAVVKDLNSGPLGAAFLSELQTVRPSDFIVPLELGDLDGPLFNDFRPEWAFLRADVVGHGRGGIRALMTLEDDATFDRGRFGRMVGVAVPHNGSLVSVYLTALQNRLRQIDTSGQLLSHIPAAISQNTQWSALTDTSASANALLTLNPASELFYSKEEFSHPLPIHHVAVSLSGKSPSAFDLVKLDAAIGGDGVVDFDSQYVDLDAFAGNVTGLSTRETFISFSGPPHGEPVAFFGGAPGQMQSPAIASIITTVLDDPNEFRPYIPPESSLFSRLEVPAQAAFDAPAEILVDIVGIPSPSPPSSGGGAASPPPGTDYDFEITPAPGYPLVGDVTWFAERFAPGGVTTVGLTVTPDGSDPLKVTVTVEDGLLGDVMLYASYETSGGKLVFARPERVVTTLPDGEFLNGIDVLPATITVNLGETIIPEIIAKFSGGTQMRRAVQPGDVGTVGISQTGVVDVSNPMEWEAIGEGTVTISLPVFGFSNAAIVTVVDPFPTANLEDWKAARYDTTELADLSITGDGVDLDGDTLDLFFEFLTGGEDRVPDTNFLPNIRTIEIDGVATDVLAIRLSKTVADVESVSVETSTGLAGWVPFADFSGGFDPDHPFVADFRDFGDFHEIYLEIPPGLEQQFFRLAALGELQPGPITGTTELTFEGAIPFEFEYGDRVSGPTDGSFVYGGNPGYTPQVEVRYGFGNSILTNGGTGDLVPLSLRGASEGHITVRLSADPGYLVEVAGFDVGVSTSQFSTDPSPESVTLTDLNGGVLTEILSPVIPRATHADFDFAPGQAVAGEIEIRVNTSNFNSQQRLDIAMDNIRFSQRQLRDFGDATELTFDHGAETVNGNLFLEADYGDRVTGPVDGAVSYRGVGSFTPNVVVDYVADSRVDADGYGNFRDCLTSATGVLRVVLTADPGYIVALQRFDVAAEENRHLSDPTGRHVRVTDDTGAVLFEELSPTISHDARSRYSFVSGPLESAEITIEVDTTLFTSSRRVGMDNILFSQRPAP